MLRFMVAAFAVTAVSCGIGGEANISGSQTDEADQAIRWNPCATVRCAAGYVCKARGRHASCVPAPGTPSCVTDADCRLFSDYCTGCDCRALASNQPDPVCSGGGVACFVDPCFNKVATCQAGSCVASTAPVGTVCGNTVCAAGDVCCNSSCGICTPPGGFCTQQVCSGGETCGNTVCAAGTVCCNASCGICTPPDGACTQQVCDSTR
jgi:hypothetical protein